MLRIDPPTEEATELWRTVAELAREFGSEGSWCLIGGLMVQLYAYEHAASPRSTEDIDVLGDARRRPSSTEELAQIVTGLGGEPETPPTTEPRLGYRFQIGGQVLEILGPDGLKSPPRTLGNLETIEVHGGTQALRRSETVTISVAGGPQSAIRRPTLLAAILLKARALTSVKRKFEAHRQDLILLLSLVHDPRALAEGDGLTTTEREWLATARRGLNLEDASLRDRFSEAQLLRARQALALLASG